MNVFLDALRKLQTVSLVCPKCKACNRPGATVVELDQTGSRAFCAVCSHEGVVDLFQPKVAS